MPSLHRTVLLHEAIESLAIKSEHIVVDATLGSGGHARAIIERLGPQGTFIGIDADEVAIAAIRQTFSAVAPRTLFVHANFRTLPMILTEHQIGHIDRALFDLGWRIEQLTGRGFSFAKDEPLLMTFDAHPSAGTLTAREIVNEWDENHIADILYGWGGEHFSRRIAHAIVLRRAEKPIERTLELADIVSRAAPSWYRARRIHPATKTFQALRIAVNDEMGALEEGLKAAHDALAPHGRIAVITFHSIEDRIVKFLFRSWNDGAPLTKKPIIASRAETLINPRARSAKLRIFEKDNL